MRTGRRSPPSHAPQGPVLHLLGLVWQLMHLSRPQIRLAAVRCPCYSTYTTNSRTYRYSEHAIEHRHRHLRGNRSAGIERPGPRVYESRPSSFRGSGGLHRRRSRPAHRLINRLVKRTTIFLQHIRSQPLPQLTGGHVKPQPRPQERPAVPRQDAVVVLCVSAAMSAIFVDVMKDAGDVRTSQCFPQLKPRLRLIGEHDVDAHAHALCERGKNPVRGVICARPCAPRSSRRGRSPSTP